MDQTTIMKYKKLLEENLENVKKDIQDLTESSKPIKPENSLGRLTRMDAIGQKSINDHALNNAKLKRQKIEAALKRIKEDEFGYCVECGDEISEKRLNAVPESPQCMECIE